MTNFPCKKKIVNLENAEVVLYDLSLGFLIDCEAGSVDESFFNVLKDASSMAEDDIKKLRKSEAEYLVKEVMALTYGIKEDGEESKEGDKKK